MYEQFQNVMKMGPLGKVSKLPLVSAWGPLSKISTLPFTDFNTALRLDRLPVRTK